MENFEQNLNVKDVGEMMENIEDFLNGKNGSDGIVEQIKRINENLSSIAEKATVEDIKRLEEALEIVKKELDKIEGLGN